ncbi:unnamed protein product [Rangifer tarandus platyrhynchus]|uniref:Uncharacterized protein n=2 Tax=Rangifer tarandus platyrhynchus TaxID=3082113 RepID=A0ABN8ZL89_RANTA|nr:unnamed protein product [Rangifer tarandus platyrhynchus]
MCRTLGDKSLGMTHRPGSLGRPLVTEGQGVREIMCPPEGLLEIHAGRLGADPSCSPGEARSFSTTSIEVCRLYLSPAAPRDHQMSALTERKVGLLLSQV